MSTDTDKKKADILVAVENSAAAAMACYALKQKERKGEIVTQDDINSSDPAFKKDVWELFHLKITPEMREASRRAAAGAMKDYRERKRQEDLESHCKAE